MTLAVSVRPRGPKAFGASRRLLDLALESKPLFRATDPKDNSKKWRYQHNSSRIPTTTALLLMSFFLVSIGCGFGFGVVFEWRRHREGQHLRNAVHRDVHSDGSLNFLPEKDKISRGLSRTTTLPSNQSQHEKEPVSFATTRVHRKKGLWVDYGVAGNEVEFSEAFYPGRPYTREEDLRFEQLQISEEKDCYKSRFGMNEVRLFIAVTATACSERSRERRNAIRQTWMQDAQDVYEDVKVRFFIGQPDACDKTMIGRLKKEIREHGDIVFIRQHDVYTNLFNKTHGMLKYYLSDPGKYTHVLKTDEDVYVRVEKVLGALTDDFTGPRTMHVYKGYMENPRGFTPFRDPTSKWYQSFGEFDEDMAKEVRGTQYLAGWGYVLSRDVALHAMKKFQRWELRPETAPRWQHKFHNLEDIMVGILVSDYVTLDSDYRFKPAWRKCTRSTAVIHLDIDAPALFDSLHQQDRSGVWDTRTVKCSSGDFVSGDWQAWHDWRDAKFADGQKTM